MSVLMERLVGRSCAALVSGSLPAESVIKEHGAGGMLYIQMLRVECSLEVVYRQENLIRVFPLPPKLLTIGTYFCLIFFSNDHLKK